MLDPVKLATAIEPVEGRRSFEVAPTDLYPAMVAHIQEGLKAGQFAEEDLRTGYVDQARALSDEAWALVLQPIDQVTHPENRQLRAQALRIARKWFQERLHQAIGGDRTPFFLRITRDAAYQS